MGQNTVVVIVGFLGLHIAFILAVLSLGTPFWLERTAFDNASYVNGSWHNATEHKYSFGLFQQCDDGICQGLNITSLPAWHKITLSLDALGCIVLAVCLAMTYVFVLTNEMARRKLNNVLCLTLAIAIALEIAGLALWGSRYKLVSTLAVFRLGWSFYMGIGGAALSGLALLVHLVLVFRFRTQTMAYVEIE